MRLQSMESHPIYSADEAEYPKDWNSALKGPIQPDQHGQLEVVMSRQLRSMDVLSV